MGSYICVSSLILVPKEYNGFRVVTFQDIDQVHGRAAGTASRIFRENRNKFIESEDFILLKGESLRNFKQMTNFVACTVRELHLITESGYLMLVKSFTDDLAWAVQRELVNHYFRGKQIKRVQGKAKRRTVVDIPQNQKFQEKFDYLRKKMIALEVMIDILNRYGEPKEMDAYLKAIGDIGCQIEIAAMNISRAEYDLIPEPY